MMESSGDRVLEPPQNPNPNYIPFPYNPAPLHPNTFQPQGITLPVGGATQVHVNENGNRVPKKAKIVQSQWCEVCKISCTSKIVFDIHALGKKHKKKVEKLNNPPIAVPAPVIASASTPPIISDVHPVNSPLIGPQENPDNSPLIGPQENPDKVPPSKNAVKSKKKKLAATEDMESKRRKVLDGGAPAEAVRACLYCNVVCNSETVFNYHIAGQKHAANMKKYATAMAGISFVAGAG